ncbi:MAG: amino acid adenylation domain-containing protein, partial [Aestuariibacter sp.]|nr:amino acid adenylation domain-containing protein [Aestuariibacter sp.]
HNTPEAVPLLSELTAEFLPTEVHTSKFDLSLAFAEQENGLRGTISYSTDLFDAETIARMAGHFEQLLTGMVTDLNQPIATLPLMTTGEKESLRIWHDTTKAYPPYNAMIHLFEEQATRVPDTPAIIFEGQCYHYRELNGRANQLARQLRQMGLGREQRIGLLLERSLEMMVGLLGILKAGAAYVPLDPSYPSDRIQTIATEAELVALVTHSDLMGVAPAIAEERIIQIDADWYQIAQQSNDNLDLDIQPEDLMYVLFTSGSTGKPKGVVVENQNYVSYFQSVFERMDVPDGLTYAVATTFATDLGSIMFWSALCSGGRAHVISYERATDPAAFAAYFRQYSIDVLKLVPSHYDALQLLGGADDIVPNRLLILAGETSYWETVRQIQGINPHCVVQDHYGVTETTGIMLTYTAPLNSSATGPLPKGLPLANTQLYILDDQRQLMPMGIPGEVYIGGKGVTRGYLNRPELTAVSFIPHPFNQNKEDRLYRTGDLATYQPDGTLKLLGRRDFQVKVRGYRVELGEIESTLNQLPGLDRCVVMAQSDKVGDTHLVAYIATQPNYTNQITADWVRQKLRDSLPDYMVPAIYLFLDKLPINANGKIDRPALKLLEKPTAQTATDSYVAPRTEEETQLATIWADVLDLPAVGIDDNFFDIGGESFKAIRVVRRMGSDVNVMDLFQNPTVRELANFLVSDTPHRSSLLYELTPPIAPANHAYTLVCVPYGGGSAAVYYPLAQHLPDSVSLFAVDLPGHEFSRRGEDKLPLGELAAQCVTEIQAHVSEPVVLYGHCVGSALTVAIGRLLEAEQLPLIGIFVGGNFPSPRLKQLEFFH